MQSAFGVEHGDEIAKFAMPTGILKPVTAGAKSMGSGVKTGFKAGGHDFTPMKGLSQNKNFMRGAQVGNVASKKSVQVGAGAGATGLVGGTALNRKKQY